MFSSVNLKSNYFQSTTSPVNYHAQFICLVYVTRDKAVFPVNIRDTSSGMDQWQ
jgi:hypothetical protein